MALTVTMEVPADPAALTCALEGLVRMNEHLISRAAVSGGGYPSLYESGVRYRREPRGQEDWKHIDRLLEDGIGDCEDLSGARAAELRVIGEQATAMVVPTKSGKFHAIVIRGNGEIEDPSRLLLAKEKSMPGNGKTKICIKDIGTHSLGSISLPTTTGKKIEAHELGADNWSAFKKVVGKVLTVASHPAVAAILPPQVAIALMIAKRISDMSPGALEQVSKDERSTDAQRQLARKLLAARAGEEVEEVGANTGLLRRSPKDPRVVSRTFRGQPIVRPDARDPGVQVQYPPGYTPPPTGQPYPGYPPTYPPYPPQYPILPPQYGNYPGYPPTYPYPANPPPPPMPYLDPQAMSEFLAAQNQQQQTPMMTPEEAAAIMMWGASSFAPGSFPGFEDGSQGWPGYPQEWGYGY